jgi:fermentation-respiration switch protein FrsA (DUF1100 family)
MFRIIRFPGVLSFLMLAPAVALADVNVLFDLRDPAKTIFPSDLFTDLDLAQDTLRRVALPKPDCAARAVECADIDLLNELDGFSVNPRVSIPFDGAIDPATVSSDTVYLLSLGGRGSFGRRVGIDRIVWDPASNTLFFKPDDLLEQRTRYAVIVTDGIRDTKGRRVEGPQFRRFRSGAPGVAHGDFRRGLDDAARSVEQARRDRLIAATVFTTMSTTTVLERMRREIRGGPSGTATFAIGNAGAVRAVFPVSGIANITAARQVSTAPAFAPGIVPFAALQVVPGAVGQLAFGKFTSPNFLAPGQYIPAIGTRFGRPKVQSRDEIYFDLFLPSGPKPAAGWPVALFGHGFTSDKEVVPFLAAAKLAQQGIATLSINFVGHGFGPFGTITVNTAGGPVTFPAGGRGFDQNGDGVISSVEGTGAAAPRTLIESAGALRQTIADFMQVVREIESGIDVDGDGIADLDASRTYFYGQSFGGFIGAMLLATEPAVAIGVLNVAGGPAIEASRLSPGLRTLVVVPGVAERGLLNLPPLDVPGVGIVPQFNENLPLRDQPPLVNTVPGALAIQTFFDRREWATYVASPLSFAPHIRKDPLPGNRPKSVIVQFAKGDQTVPNPANSALIRAGALLDRTTYYRNDLAFAANPATPRNPHTFLSGVLGPGLAPVVALQAQTQIATFFASEGVTVIDPDGVGPLFEVPIAGPLPEETNFIP